MIRPFLLIIFLLLSSHIFSQAKIPNSIKEDLTLKPMAKPYETNGFVVEKGATLTILPGTKILTSAGADKYCNIVVKGTIKIGDKGNNKSKPVDFEGYSPWLKFDNANIEINSLNITLVNCQFVGDCNGSIVNSNFSRDQLAIPYPMIIYVPPKGKLLITDCVIEDQGCDVKTSNFPNDLGNLIISKCAFTYTPSQNKDSLYYKKCKLNIYTFIYGSKCDSYADIAFSAFDWELKDTIETEWYVDNTKLRQSLLESSKLAKNFNLKLGTSKFTAFKQTPEPPANPKKPEKK